MNARPTLLPKILLAALVVATNGCSWSNLFRRTTRDATPVAFTQPGMPTFEQISSAVNTNSGRVKQLSSEGGSLRVPGAPAISADVALERPLKFRFRGSTTFTGPEVDIGSNDQLFWFWAGRAPQPALFFSTHQNFARSPLRAQFPVEPSWLIEGMGLTELTPQYPWEGPVAAGIDRIELRARVNTSAGDLYKIVTVHNRFAWVMETKLTDARGSLVAQSKMSEHQFYHVDGVHLPQKMEISIPAMQAAFTLEVSRWRINAPDENSAALYELPRTQLASYPLVDLAAPAANAAPPLGQPVTQPIYQPNSGPPGYPGAASAGPSAPQPSVYRLPPATDQPRLSYAPESDPRPKIRGMR